MKIKSGVRGFDDLIDGGFPKRSSVILKAPPGSEKQLFSMKFMAEGFANGGSAIIVISNKSPEILIEELLAMGIDANELLEQRRLIIIDWYSYKTQNISYLQEEGSVLKCSADLTNVRGPCPRQTRYRQTVE